jgi:hypothetical protein
MPLAATPVRTPQRLRAASAAAIAATIATGAYALTLDAEDRADHLSGSTATAPRVTHYRDVEANKARAMRALGNVSGPAITVPRFRDLEANKARAMRTLGNVSGPAVAFGRVGDLEANKARAMRTLGNRHAAD